MNMFSVAITLLVPLLVAIYTWNYGRWAWKQKLHLGAIGLYFLAALVFAVPTFMVWWTS